MTPILGISLGCRITGIAIVKGTELLAAHSITLRNKRTKAHTETVNNYIRQYQISTVVIKIPPNTHITARLEKLLEQCLSLFHYHGCMVEYKDDKVIKKCLPDLTDKLSVIEFATAAYPILTPFHRKEIANKQKYHVKMFEAVVIAHMKEAEARYINC
jgi:hypothetical protein